MLMSRRLGTAEQALFVKRLAFLMDAGVPIAEALQMLRDQSSERSRSVFERIVADVESGQSLSRSLAKFEGVFGTFALSIIQVGESTGSLSQNLSYLADELTKREALKRRIISACIYPALITLATIGITIFLIAYLFPKITPVFSSLHTELPLSTRAVMAISDFFIAEWFWILIVLVFMLFALITALQKSHRLRVFLDKVSLRLPVMGSIIRSYNLANACRALGLLTASGMQLADALTITADTTVNRTYVRAYRELREVVLRGETVSHELAQSPRLFPPIATNLIAVGERSGSLSATFLYLSDLYDGEMSDITRNLATLIEPALMIAMGLVVGFIAVSIITPIYGITQNLHA